MRTAHAAILAALAAMLAAAPPVPADAGASATYVVTANDFAWTPDALSIEPGDAVRFEAGTGFHTLASDFEACNLPCTFTFSTPGTYPFYCGVHPNMQGSITVNGPPATDLRVTNAVATQSLNLVNVAGLPSELQRSTISYTVQNAGNLGAGSFNVRVEAFYDGAWHLIEEDRIFGLGAGGNVNGNAVWQSDDVRVGSFPARVRADPANEIVESNDGNNDKGLTAFFVTNMVPGQTAGLP